MEGVAGQFETARLDAGEVQNVAEQNLKRVAGRVDQLQHLFLLRRQGRFRQRLRHADDAVQGRADLMAHIGEELALGAVGRLGHVARLGEGAGVILQVGDVRADRDDAAGGGAAVGDTKPAVAGDALFDGGGQGPP